MQWWDWVILVSGIVAALGVVLAEIRRVRNKPVVRIETRLSRIIDTTKLQIRNNGNITACQVTLVIIDDEDPEPLELWEVGTLALGQMMERKVPTIPDRTYVIITYQNPGNSNLGVMTWSPISADQELVKAYHDQLLWRWHNHLIARLRFKNLIGPEAQLKSSIPLESRRQKRMLEKVNKRREKRTKP